MKASFDLNHAKLAADPRFARVGRELSALSPIITISRAASLCRRFALPSWRFTGSCGHS